MSWFANPGFLWLAPLVTLPIIIHLLNRIRYRRVRWAAMEFLLTTERRAVRRARIQQWLLMAMRILLLTFALLALAQPVLRGRIAAMLGGSRQVAVLVDSSASMQTRGTTDTAFGKATQTARIEVKGLPSGARALAGTIGEGLQTSFAAPILSRVDVLRELADSQQTDGPSNIPQAIIDAAKRMEKPGGGTIWVLTDMQRNAWRPDDVGIWEKVGASLREAGRPSILVTDVSSEVAVNVSIEGVELSEQVPQAGETAEMEVTVRRQGPAEEVMLELYLNGERGGRSEAKQFFGADTLRIPFALRNLRKGANSGHVKIIGEDRFAGDNEYHFVVTTEARLPVLVVEGSPEAGFFLNPAISGRSPFEVETRPYRSLPADEALDRYVAIVLTEVPRMEDDVVATLNEYVASGGLLVFFPGASTELNPWNSSGVLPATFKGTVAAEEDERPVADEDIAGVRRMTVGIDQVLVRKLYELEPDTDARTIARTTQGRSFLVRKRIGRGSAYLFAVSAQDDFSNLPMRPVFLVMMRRILQDHLAEIGQPLAYPAMSQIRLELPGTVTDIIAPDKQRHKLPPAQDLREPRVFTDTQKAGIYRIDVPVTAEESQETTGEAEPELVPVAAVNVPAEESSLERIEQAELSTIEDVIRTGITVTDTSGLSDAPRRSGDSSGVSTFPLAVLAMLMIASEAAMAWYIGRPTARSENEDEV